ncbi:MAG: hypothetical protein F6J93_36340 [Oscillatoria sp. SIO1A7]|nr:hypothetical protein [Oscillatoria sp. SIO1A7]
MDIIKLYKLLTKKPQHSLAKRQVEELSLHSYRDFDEFYQAKQARSNQEEKIGDILVISVDGKGVVMRQDDLRPDTKKRAAGQKKLKKRLTKGEKRNSKRMATVAAVYTIEPILRTAIAFSQYPKISQDKTSTS